jgi:hypothetical protein
MISGRPELRQRGRNIKLEMIMRRKDGSQRQEKST